MRPSTKYRLLLMVAAPLCAVIVAGCANLQIPAVDPSGQRLLAPGQTNLLTEPGAVLPRHDAGIVLTPVHVIAPVDSEVILLAGICGLNGQLSANERVEWMISPGDVGQFVTVGKNQTFDRFFWRDNWPRKVSNTFAVGRTSRRWKVLTRGTPCAADDVPVLPGQGWISVTSPVEGTSHVTALGPDVYSWDNRKQTATVHWVDAEWSLPPPAVNPVGTRHVFTTTVMRHTDHMPVSGWRVRYEITDGPPAGFAPDGSRMVEVPTDALGQASVEIFQPQPEPGTNTVSIEIIRPKDSGPGSERLVVGSGTTSKTWTSPQLGLRKTGPNQSSVGATIIYQLELSNPGEIAARDVVVREMPSAGLTFLRSSPEPSPGATALEWRVGDLEPGQVTSIQAEFRAERAGTVQNCASATAADGLSVKDCALTTVLDHPSLEVSVVGPQQAEVGQEVTFEITVTNRGEVTAADLLLVDRFDEGLEHASGARPIERDLDDLPPGQSRRIGVTLRVTRAGRLCNRVEVRGEGDLRAQAQACLEAAQAQRPSLSVTKSGPTRHQVGDVAQFVIDVTNTGTEPLTSLKITDHYDLALDPIEATEDHTFQGDDIVWIVERLEPGQTATRRINCRCLEPATNACNRVTVTTSSGARAEDDACLEIQAAALGAPQLTVEVADLRDPVQAGRDVVYVIRVVNASPSTASEVRVTAHVPTGMSPLADGISGPTRFEVDGQTIRFQPVDHLDSGQTVAYEVHVRAQQPGNVLFRVEVNAEGLAEPIIQEHGTTVFAGP